MIDAVHLKEIKKPHHTIVMRLPAIRLTGTQIFDKPTKEFINIFHFSAILKICEEILNILEINNLGKIS